ncbi:hypothetical protein CHU92_00720, partial [Flavobacterium cyanobacteriorum]
PPQKQAAGRMPLQSGLAVKPGHTRQIPAHYTCIVIYFHTCQTNKQNNNTTSLDNKIIVLHLQP